MGPKFEYPDVRRDDSCTEDFHGTEVKDPYRWMEDPDSTETQNAVEAENKRSQPFLENCEEWKKINEKLTKLWEISRTIRQNRWFRNRV